MKVVLFELFKETKVNAEAKEVDIVASTTSMPAPVGYSALCREMCWEKCRSEKDDEIFSSNITDIFFTYPVLYTIVRDGKCFMGVLLPASGKVEEVPVFRKFKCEWDYPEVLGSVVDEDGTRRAVPRIETERKYARTKAYALELPDGRIYGENCFQAYWCSPFGGRTAQGGPLSLTIESRHEWMNSVSDKMADLATKMFEADEAEAEKALEAATA